MSKLYLKGCGTALVTPFKDNCEVDYEAYAACVDRQVEAGVHFLVPLATTGETPTLGPGEKKELLRITREHVGDMPLLAGCGTNSLDGTLANTPVKNLAVTKAVLRRLDPALLDPPPEALTSLEAYQAMADDLRAQHRRNQGGLRQIRPGERDDTPRTRGLLRAQRRR